MRIVCAWCNKDMGEKDGKGVGGVSHGLCVENGIMTGLAITEDTEEIKKRYWFQSAAVDLPKKKNSNRNFPRNQIK